MKRLLLASAGTIMLVGGVCAATSLTLPESAGADDTPIIQTLQNHEQRITNLEKKEMTGPTNPTTPTQSAPGEDETIEVGAPAPTAPSAGTTLEVGPNTTVTTYPLTITSDDGGIMR